jgi:hypothetical protein
MMQRACLKEADMTQTAQKPRRRVIRPAGIRVVNLSLPVEAVELLHPYAPSSKSYGLFVATLLYEHRASGRTPSLGGGEVTRPLVPRVW